MFQKADNNPHPHLRTRKRMGGLMSRIVRCSLIQASNAAPPEASLEATKSAMVEKHVAYIQQARCIM